MYQNLNDNERRRFIRHPMCFPLKYKVLKRGFFVSLKEELVRTKNISEGGLLFCAKKAAEVNSLLSIKIPFQEKMFNVHARVIRCARVAGSQLFDIGVSFQRYNDAFRVKLIEQLYLISEYRDLRSMQLGKEVTLEDASREWIQRYSKRFARLYW